LVFRAIDPKSGQEYYFLPGGAIEENETAPESAVRETLEETSYKIKIDPLTAVDKDYQFFWNGQTYDCTTIFYRGYLNEPFHLPHAVKDASYNKGALWLPVSDVPKIFSYSADIKEAVAALLL
jgi:8-oxo-dGTP pyrophosphatase MutT (NUDIX family)